MTGKPLMCTDAELDRAVQALHAGRLVILPTETVYGLAALATRPDAIERIYEAKSRERNKPIPLLAADRSAVEQFGALLGNEERQLADAFWPGPLTLVLNLRQGGTEGFRVPAHPIALQLLRAVGGILRVTSCNLSGEPPTRSAQEATASLGQAVACVLDGGPVTDGIPSTVARIENGRLTVLRPGALPADQLLARINTSNHQKGRT